MPEDTGGEDGQEQDLVPTVGAAAAGVLRFSEERDPAVLTQFVRLRVIDPKSRGVVVPARRSQSDRWAANLAAARQFHAREGHLRPARKHIEIVDGEEIKLGSFLDNIRRRAAKLPAERRADLDALDMRW
ncbi:helicase associated domain-containing protein [Streptomyces sp. NPDC006356]